MIAIMSLLKPQFTVFVYLLFWIVSQLANNVALFCKKQITTSLLFPTREDSTHGHYQMVNTKIRLIIFFAAKDGEALYSQQKQDQELTMAQIINSFVMPKVPIPRTEKKRHPQQCKREKGIYC